MEGRDSQQWQPNRRGKGSVGACVSRGWRKHPQIRHGSSRFVYIRSKTASFDIWPHFTRFVYRSGIRMRLHGFFFFDSCTASFAVNNHLSGSGKASCRPWSSQNDHPGHISSLFQVQAIRSARINAAPLATLSIVLLGYIHI